MPRVSTSKQKYALLANLKVGVFLGGSSSERKISLKSGQAVNRALQKAGVKTVKIDPSRSSKLTSQLKQIDLAFIALHGLGGEDGTLQRRLQQQRIPYVGSSARACGRAFDKVKAKRVFKKKSIRTPDFRVINSKNWKKTLHRFGLPVFVKPVQEGSSIGAYAIEESGKMADKLMRSLNQYSELLIERKIEGRELTVGILGKKALPVIELRPKRSFYDFKSKYTKGMTRYLLPAPISRELALKLQKIALRVHSVLGLRDMSRVDFMLDEKQRPYVLEANTIPGFTELSLLPKAAKYCGIPFEELCCQLLKMAWERK